VVVSGDKGVLMTIKPDIDPKNGKIDAPVDLGGAPEFLASDGAGKVYVNLMDKNEVAVVDLKARKVVARWPVAPGGAPVGMSIDTQKRRLFIGCRKPQKLIVMSTENGKVLADLPIGAGVDATKFHNGQAFASCADRTLVVAAETSPGTSTLRGGTAFTRPVSSYRSRNVKSASAKCRRSCLARRRSAPPPSEAAHPRQPAFLRRDWPDSDIAIAIACLEFLTLRAPRAVLSSPCLYSCMTRRTVLRCAGL